MANSTPSTANSTADWTGLFESKTDGNATAEDTEQMSKCFVDCIYGTLLRILAVLVGIILTIVLMLMTKRKRLCRGCCGGYYALIVPVNFLEDRRKRKVILAVCALMTLDIMDILEGQDASTSDVSPYAKVFVKVGLVAVISLKFLPFLRCIYVASISTCILGLLYAGFNIAVMIVSGTPNPELPIVDLVDDLILRSIVIFVAGVYILYWFMKRIVLLAMRRKPFKDAVMGKYEAKYVKNMLLSEGKRPADRYVLSLMDESKFRVVKSWFRKNVYYNAPGFKYSLTILVSCTVGFLGITKAATKAMAKAVFVYNLLFGILKGLEEEKGELKIPNFVQTVMGMIDKRAEFEDAAEIDLFAVVRVQIIVVMVAMLASVVIAYLLSCVLICRLLVNYRTNVLNLSRRKSERDILPFTSMSNVSFVMSAIQYLGYQVAYLISGFTVQSAFLIISLVIICEIVLFPIQFASKAFVGFVLRLVGPILIVLILIKGTQYILIRFAFLEDNGKTLAITNRRGFFITMYVVFFYNVFTGFISCIVRILKCALIGIVMVPRLDSSLFPIWFARYDAGFKAYSCLLHLEALQCNPILRTFVNILLKANAESIRIYSYTTENDPLTARIKEKKKRNMIIARNRWFVAVTLMRNPMLAYQRAACLRSGALKNEDVKVIRPLNDNAANERETII